MLNPAAVVTVRGEGRYLIRRGSDCRVNDNGFPVVGVFEVGGSTAAAVGPVMTTIPLPPGLQFPQRCKVCLPEQDLSR